MSKVHTRFCGYCPKINDTRTILISYDKLFFSGDPAPHYAKAEYSCDGSSGCPHLDQYGRCPVYLLAPEKPSR